MGFWKTFCTCAGCAIGAACIVLSGGTATPLVVAVAVGAGGVAGHLAGSKIEKDEKKVKNKEKELQIKDQTIESIRKENNNLAKEKNNLVEQINQKEKNAKQKEQEIKNIETKLKDPNVSEEDKTKLKQKLAMLKANLADEQWEIKGLKDKHKETEEQIKNNNKTISSVGSGSYGKDKGIFEYLTLENILIAFAIYALWQIVKEDKK